MAVCRIFDVQGATLEQYDQVAETLGPETGPNKPAGAIFHVAGHTGKGLKVIEVWESPEDADRYAEERLGAAMQEFDLPEPQITEFEVHNTDWQE